MVCVCAHACTCVCCSISSAWKGCDSQSESCRLGCRCAHPFPGELPVSDEESSCCPVPDYKESHGSVSWSYWIDSFGGGWYSVMRKKWLCMPHVLCAVIQVNSRGKTHLAQSKRQSLAHAVVFTFGVTREMSPSVTVCVIQPSHKIYITSCNWKKHAVILWSTSIQFSNSISFVLLVFSCLKS